MTHRLARQVIQMSNATQIKSAYPRPNARTREKMRSRSNLANTLGFGLAVMLANACNERTSEHRCYQRNEALDWEGRPELAPYCEWPAGGLPSPGESYANTWKVHVAFYPTGDEPCDPCDTEHFDTILEAKVQEQCALPFELVRGCYQPAEEQPAGQCVVYGLYHTDCERPTED
jgi:hypothetical protein